jgi:NTE family protein
MATENVAVVLSGAAARGAFQAGALAYVVPTLEAQGHTVKVFIGTSAGAINAALWSSFAHLGSEQAGEALLKVWQSMGQDDVFTHPFLSLPRVGWDLLRSSLHLGGGIDALLDTEPLAETARQHLLEEQLAANVSNGVIDAVGVVGTRMPRTSSPDGVSSGRSVVFMDTLLPSDNVADPTRAVDLAAGEVKIEHVMASAAIPMAFPAVWVPEPASVQGWYNDGGVRLNTPLRPGIALGADRLVVIAANSTRYGAAPPPAPDDEPQPDVTDAAAQMMHAMLADQMTEDLNALRTRNHLAEEASAAGTTATRTDGTAYRTIPYLSVSPEPGQLAGVVDEVLGDKWTAKPWQLWADSGNLLVAQLMRTIGDGPGRAELLSYLAFDETYFSEQVVLGRAAAKAAIGNGWQV